MDGEPIPCREVAAGGLREDASNILYFKLRRRTRVSKLIQAWAHRQRVPPRRLQLWWRGICLYRDVEPGALGRADAPPPDPRTPKTGFPMDLTDGDLLQLYVGDEPGLV